MRSLHWPRAVIAARCPFERTGKAGKKVKSRRASTHRRMGRKGRHGSSGPRSASPGAGDGTSRASMPAATAPGGDQTALVVGSVESVAGNEAPKTGVDPRPKPTFASDPSAATGRHPQPEEEGGEVSEPDRPPPEAEPEPEPDPEPTPEPASPPSVETEPGEPERGEGESGWFAPGSVWNRELGPSVPLAAESSTYVAELLRQVDTSGAWINSEEYSTPVYTVGAAQPPVKVEMISYSGSWIPPALEAALAMVPIPPGAEAAPGTDKHLVVWQPSTDQMWEFWGLRMEGGQWVAAWGGAMKDVSDSPGYYTPSSWPGAESGWGATATSLPLVGGLMTIKELEALSIEHALALAIPDPGVEHVWPAQRGDGFETRHGAIPEGTIFRLPPDLDLKALGLTPVGLAIAEAAQRYGMVVRDTSGCVSLYAEEAPEGATTPYATIFDEKMPSAVLAGFPWSDLVAIQPGD